MTPEDSGKANRSSISTYRDYLYAAGRLAAAVAVRVEGKLHDLCGPFHEGFEVESIVVGSPEGLTILRHSTSHIMAEAVGNLYKNVRFDIGPAIEDGFYYDFDLDGPIGAEDLEKIEAEMRRIVELGQPFKRIQLPREEAIRLMEERDQTYKAARLRHDITEDVVSLYQHGDFLDVCLGPHVPDMSYLGTFKLLSVAGSYWRGDERNPMLQRIYGTAFADKTGLEEHLRLREEARKRDHRRLGRELDLFSFHEEGPGFAFWHPKGLILFNTIVDYWRAKHAAAGYQEIKTPIILNESLWHQSGHWDHYRSNMYFTKIDEINAAVKPMNCPGMLLIYRSRMWSYRDFPLKLAEIGLVHRHEKSGVLAGLLRVRAFHQDDAHIFCSHEQIEDEVIGIIKLLREIYGDFGFEQVKVELSTRPKDSIGTDRDWEVSEEALRKVLSRLGTAFEVNPGEGAFYGPKIDFHVRDALKRSWQCGTIQLDFSMPQRFELEFTGPDGAKHTPVMIHRTILGALERFIAILLENTGGALPVWLSPVQVRMLPISEKHLDYSRQIVENLKSCGVRADLDERNEKIGQKIRQATVDKVPYMLVAGAKEVETRTVSVRKRGEGDLGARPLEEFMAALQGDIDAKR